MVGLFHVLTHLIIKIKLGDYPSGPVVKSLPANAGDAGLTPDLGRPLVPWNNSACAQLRSRACAPQQESNHTEKPTQHNKE